MRFQLLGPVSAYDQRGPVDLGPAKQRTVLAVLLVGLGSPVSADQLVERVWGASPPQRAQRTLHSYLSRLRGVLNDAGQTALTRRDGDYLLDADRSAVDMHRFRSLSAEARRASDDEHAARLWQEALAVWQGAPFSGLQNDWLRTVAIRLEAERWAATLDRNDVLLRCGEHHRLLPELSVAAAEHPLDERLAGQLMLALYRSGRQVDALAHYRWLHDRLVEELGSDPGAHLRELHQRILRQDPDLERRTDIVELQSVAAEDAVLSGADHPTASPAPQTEAAQLTGSGPGGRAEYLPAQLPADVTAFTGREDVLRRLDAMLDEPADQRNLRAVVITAIAGTAGVGKTALAVHWGHRVAERFPDGQLYLNLRGYDPEQPVSPPDALARLLTAIGVKGTDLPVDVDERAALYRSEMAGRRMLVVLDNAASVSQVRPLLPGSGPCQVVVTSRDSLAGLVAVHGAQRIDLDLLPSDEAVGLLSKLIGPLVEAEPEAAAALAEQCARLPLALRVAAELVVARPGESLAQLVAELADRQSRLELLEAGGDPHSEVREVFSWSLQLLPAESVAVFRLLGLHPGPDFETYAVAALSGIGFGPARWSLERLARAQLVRRTGPGRYGMHDLLRAYAADLTTAELGSEDVLAAQDRLLDYYRSAAAAAMDVLHPADTHHRPKASGCWSEMPELTDVDAAYAWVSGERVNLAAIAAHASSQGRAGYVVGLARILHRYMEGANPAEALAINGHARRAAAQAGDLNGEGHALRQLGTVYNRLSRFEEAVQLLEQALGKFQATGDIAGEALALTGLGIVNYRMGDHKLPIEDHGRAIVLARQAGDRLTEGYALVNLGVVEERVGRYPEAVEHQREAVAVLRELGSRYGAGVALSNLANVELRQGEYRAAAGHLRESLEILQELGSPVAEAHTWDTFGLLHLRLGEPYPAADSFQKALDLYRHTGDRNGQAWSLNGLGEVAVLLGEFPEALEHHRQAITIAAETGTRHQHARGLAGLGYAYRGLGELAKAREHLEAAYAEYTDLLMLEAEEVGAALASLDERV